MVYKTLHESALILVVCAASLFTDPFQPCFLSHCFQPNWNFFPFVTCSFHLSHLSCLWAFAWLSRYSELSSSYMPLVRANSCSSFRSLHECQFLQEAFSVSHLELGPLHWAPIIPWISSNIALSCLLNFPLPPTPTSPCCP